MDIEQAVYHLLKNDAAVTALVSGRIFSGIQPQEVVTYPALMYKSDGNFRTVETLQGGCALFEQRMMIFSAGKSYRAASQLDRAVFRLLDEFRDDVINNDSPPESLFVQIKSDSPAHDHEYEDKTSLHHFWSAYIFTWTDPVRVSV